MCAINGIFDRRGAHCSDTDLSASLEALADYGSDGSGKWFSACAGLGHQRTKLFSEPVSDENLPCHDVDAGLVITADARLDNRSEIGSALGISENRLAEISDARLILLAWRKWERDCPSRLIGDYAFAIWDERRKTLFCARDHAGVRPFYYSLTAERAIFASHIRGVTAVPGVSSEIDEEYVKAFVAERLYRKDRTYFAAIRLLPPGHSLTIRSDSEKLERFWFPENARDVRFADDAEYAEAALEIYRQAVADRLRTTAKVGVHLTGGLDSSSVAVLAARTRQQNNLPAPVGYSWQPAPAENAELSREHQFIEVVCAQENLTAQYCPASSADVLSMLKKDPFVEPTEGTMMLEIAVQRQAAADGVRLILSGWGGDETLSHNGDGYYAGLLLRGHWWRLFWESRKSGSPLRFIAKQIVLLCFTNYIEGMNKIKYRSLRYQASADSYIHPKFKGSIKLKNVLSRQTSVRSSMLSYCRSGSHAERIESWTAHGAARGINYVYPLLDRRLMEFAIGLPPEQFVRGKWRRWIMRKTVENILPAKVCWNQSKDEPVLFEQFYASLYPAFAAARQQIMAANEPPSRADYLDMDKLLRNLQPEILAEHPRPGHIRRALQVLDF